MEHREVVKVLSGIVNGPLMDARKLHLDHLVRVFDGLPTIDNPVASWTCLRRSQRLFWYSCVVRKNHKGSS